MRNNISIIRNCFGCGVCVISCPKHIIQMRFNADGFYEPFVTDENKCVNCSLCLKNCSFYNTKDDFEHSCVDGIASWSNDPEVRAASSSGGAGFEIARYLVGLGYTFCGVRYNAEKGRAEHYLTDTVDGLKPSEGSKYIQSLTVEAFKKIDFKNGRYVVVGTPCQIASLHRIIERKKRRTDSFWWISSVMAFRQCFFGGNIAVMLRAGLVKSVMRHGATSRLAGMTHGQCP